MNIIALSFHYPPNGASGSIRNHKMLSALEKEGATLTVHVGDRSGKFETPESPNLSVVRSGCFYPVDWMLKLRNRILPKRNKKDIGEKTRDAEHIPSRAADNDYRPVSSGFKDFITDLLSTPDRELMWFFSSIASAWKRNKNSEVDLVYAIGKPWVALMSGVVISSIFRKPLVIDFMDPWISNPTRRKKAKILDWYEERLESWVINKADWIVANTDELKKDFVSRYPHAESKIGVITCGYDPEDFPSNDSINSTNAGEVLTITHTGSLYAMRNPVNVLKALKQIANESLIPEGKIKLQFIGDLTLVNQEVSDLISELQEKGILELYARMQYEKALKMLGDADIAMIIQPVTKLQIPAKLYEYVCFRKPIFAIAEPGGAVERIVKSYQWGVSVRDEVEDIKNGICTTYSKLSNREPLSNYTNKDVGSFSYPALAREFLKQVAPLTSAAKAN